MPRFQEEVRRRIEAHANHREADRAHSTGPLFSRQIPMFLRSVDCYARLRMSILIGHLVIALNYEVAYKRFVVTLVRIACAHKSCMQLKAHG